MSRESLSERHKRLMAACLADGQDWDTPEPPPAPKNPYLMHRPFQFMHEGHMVDVMLFHNYLYRVVGKPEMSDKDFDEMEKTAQRKFPHSAIHGWIGSTLGADYPVYVREMRWPNEQEREDRDARWGIGQKTAPLPPALILACLAFAPINPSKKS